ncbi:MAG: glycosyltransferase family 2 protein [Wenzhouxiangella sp.]
MASTQTTQRPIVSAITPVYNGAPWLGEALDSALAQTFQALEVIVVNDGSTDDSLAIAQERATRSNGRIRVIDQANAGLPAARNVAMGCARGDYFALLDADDTWLPRHIASAVRAFERDPDLGLVHANIERMDEAGRALGVRARQWDQQRDAFEAIALRHEHVSCPTAVFSREAVNTVGGFDTDFTGLGCEDRDLWLRIAARFRIAYLDHVAARYRVHATSMSSQHERMDRARRQLIVKLAGSVRGRDLVTSMEAMVDSDIGLGFLNDGRYGKALAQQWRALRLDPSSRVIRRRLLRALLHAGSAVPVFPARILNRRGTST